MLYKSGIIFGSFDMFHVGHLNILRTAKNKCDNLVVCLLSDEYIEDKNGYKPIIPLYQRFKILMSCVYVDDVEVINGDQDKESLVFKMSPDVIFVGDSRKTRFRDDKLFNTPVLYLPYERAVSLRLLRKRLKNENA